MHRAWCSESWDLSGTQTLNFHVILEQPLYSSAYYLQNISYRYMLRITLGWYQLKYFWKFKVAKWVLDDTSSKFWVTHNDWWTKMMPWLDRDHSTSSRPYFYEEDWLLLAIFWVLFGNALKLPLCGTETIRDGLLVTALPPGLETYRKSGCVSPLALLSAYPKAFLWIVHRDSGFFCVLWETVANRNMSILSSTWRNRDIWK